MGLRPTKIFKTCSIRFCGEELQVAISYTLVRVTSLTYNPKTTPIPQKSPTEVKSYKNMYIGCSKNIHLNVLFKLLLLSLNYYLYISVYIFYTSLLNHYMATHISYEPPIGDKSVKSPLYLFTVINIHGL